MQKCLTLAKFARVENQFYMDIIPDLKSNISFEDFKTEVLNDYTVAVRSRECSLLGRREVLTGKAKFGIFGDGK